MSNVYFAEINQNTDVGTVQSITQELLDCVIEKEGVELKEKVPLKVHFGEKGNTTFIRSGNYHGILDYLEQRNIESCYIESSVMYGGQRHCRELHLKTAEEHGFTQLPIIIADGLNGEAYANVEINKKQFQTCKIGKEFLDYDQYIVLSHFKGHRLAGFGGALKQLSMGFAAKGGKMAMHMGIKPHIISRKCKQCRLCLSRCNENAITIGEKSSINQNACVGCGACVSICPHHAVSIITVTSVLRFLGVGNNFLEKLMEYAYGAQKGRTNIYMNFIMNITGGCDCEPKKMKILMDDIGICVSTDPVAIDQACFDMVRDRGKTFKGEKQLKYAEKIGIGSTEYKLIQVN